MYFPKGLFPSELSKGILSNGNFPNVQFPKRQFPKSVLATVLDPPPIAACDAWKGLT